MTQTKRPNSRRNLDMAIGRLFGDRNDNQQIRTVMANVIVGQMLPEGVVKGGSSLKLRFGDATTRFTTDLDTARVSDMDCFEDAMTNALRTGWEGFTGRLVEKDPAHPTNVPTQYLMQPFEVKLSYNRKPWCTVPLEVGHDEIGDAEDPDLLSVHPDISVIFTSLGFPEPGPVPLMPIHYQVAQKLHGVSEEGSHRTHDLIDLQLIETNAEIDLCKTRKTCIRLFAYRQLQMWPPTVVKNDGWDGRYALQADGLDVLSTADEAVAWANALIERIDDSSRDGAR